MDFAFEGGAGGVLLVEETSVNGSVKIPKCAGLEIPKFKPIIIIHLFFINSQKHSDFIIKFAKIINML